MKRYLLLGALIGLAAALALGKLIVVLALACAGGAE